MFEEESTIYRVFISHIGEDEEEYSKFIEKLSAAYAFEYENFSVLKKDKTTENELQEQIEPVGIVIVLSGLYNKYKNIIQRQIDVSKKLNKPIIVIRPYGMENVPSELEEIAEDVVDWNTPGIVDAIKESYLEYD